MSGSATVVGELAENVQEDAQTEQVTEVKQEPQQEAPKAPGTPPWLQRKIDIEVRRRGESERRAEIAERRAAEAEALLRKAAEAVNPEEAEKLFKDTKPVDPANVEQAVLSKAEEIAAVQRFNEACNQIYAQGSEEFSDFPDRIKLAQTAGVLNPAIVEAALELGDAHKVLYALTEDLDAAARMADLPPVRMAAALAKFALSKRSAPKVSSAPPPITPVQGAVKPQSDPEKMSPAEWRKWREEQIAAKARR